MKDKSENQTAAQPSLDSTSTTTPALSFRAATPSDQDFLFALFGSTRSEELAGLSSDPKQAEAFIKMQFTMQLQNFRALYPTADNNIIQLAGQPIGRILIERTAAEFLLLDIAILPEYRSNGIGGTLIQDLLTEASAQARPVRLYVVNSNPAARLYERLGFSPISNDGVYVEMKWTG
jgi:ribosomal protein S18 acetylase RimI-like enzyme